MGILMVVVVWCGGRRWSGCGGRNLWRLGFGDNREREGESGEVVFVLFVFVCEPETTRDQCIVTLIYFFL